MAFKKSLGILWLILPFLAMFYFIAVNEMNFQKYQEYRVEITGYDPVNILTGHYLSFRYKWPEHVKDSCKKKDECFACFSGAPEKPDIRFVSTKDIEACDAALILENGQPDHNLTEYHVSETQAATLDNMLRERNGKFDIGLIIYPDHNGQIKELYIDNQKLSDFFK